MGELGHVTRSLVRAAAFRAMRRALLWLRANEARQESKAGMRSTGSSPRPDIGLKAGWMAVNELAARPELQSNRTRKADRTRFDANRRFWCKVIRCDVHRREILLFSARKEEANLPLRPVH
jgi:hypothetical protein